ncbi:MAG: uroporphyrinogen-III C-methyltransferase [Casimicrobiaceae bacterium]|nr:uroporphyrinogen-III C-methyltransferase [Casimicrobiaceae bacterium]MCX8098387.1 uroporphyrinogen-III C-methyltransferase [Casimicrobiaceae bacterium]MDW8312549.1 uroporphyrinogen-III C-methyltransferase [Burkholderiales bacterium]
MQSTHRPRETLKRGFVHFVGAGPGDPELLTLKAVRVLREAQVVLVDDLAGEAVLAYCPQARIVPVGKRGGCRSTPQAFIERLMVHEALAGRRVVRLKGGDPTIFGRLGEEIAALDRAGVPWSIVPGITAGVAAAASLGLSLTHRAHAHGVAFITGHGAEGAAIDWRGLATSGMTLVAYMAVARAGELAQALIAGGLSEDTPVVAVERVGHPAERQIASTLGMMRVTFERERLSSPAVIIIGRALATAADAIIDALREAEPPLRHAG